MLLTTTSVVHALTAAVAAPAPAADISSDLLQLAQQFQAYQKSATVHSAAVGPAGASKAVAKFTPKNVDVRLLGQTVLVDAVASGTTAQLSADLVRLGAKITGTAGRMVSAYVPLTAINSLKSLASLREAAPASFTVQGEEGSEPSEGDQAMETEEVRQFLSLNGKPLDGSGVTIGVISDSYDDCPVGQNGVLTTATQDVASGDLPGKDNLYGYTTPVDVLWDGSDPYDDANEGRAMLEIIHTVAPGAALMFASGDAGDANMVAAIQALQKAGANIIVDDLGFDDELFFQDGVISQAVTAAVNAGVHYFSAAGNDGTGSYQGAFNAGATATAMSGTGQDGIGTVTIAAGTLDNFKSSGGTDDYQRITVPDGSSVDLLLQWDQPGYSAGGAACQNEVDDYLLSARSLTPANVVAYSNTSTVGADPVQDITFTNDGSYGTDTFYLAIESDAGYATPGLLKYVLNDDGDTSVTIDDYATNSGTAFGHPMAPGAAPVGAADYSDTPAYGVSPPQLESYSSEGGIPILFNTAGVRYGSPVIRQAPLFVAPDGVNTAVWGPDAFSGTSAAAPHAAALDALLLQIAPSLAPATAYTDLENTAIAMDASSGVPNVYAGYGLVDGLAAVETVGGPYTVTLAGTSGNDQFNISCDTSGDVLFKLNGTLQFTFPLTHISNIVVTGDGGSDTLTIDNSNGNPIPAGGLSYDASGDTAAVLDVSGGAFTSISDTLTGAEAANITLAGASSPTAVQCTGITSVSLAATSVANLTFSLPAGPNPDVVLGDDSGGKAGISEIHGSTLPDTTFVNPTNSLTVNLGPNGDVLTLQPMDAAFNPAGTGVAAPLMINGGTDGGTLDINDTHTGVRTLTFAFPTPLSGGLGITGFGPAIALSEIRQVSYAGGSDDNDQATVIGSNNADQFTVTPTGAHSATVVLDGGSPGPNLAFSGLASSGGLTLDGALPATAPGDTLMYSTSGTATVNPSSPSAGTITATGMLEVAYLDFEAAPVVGGLPTANAGGPYEISEGDNLILNGSGSIAAGSATLEDYSWSLDGSPLIDAGSSAQITVPWSTILALGSAASPLTTHTVGLEVTDSNGAVATATASLTIQHVPPTLAISGVATAYATLPYQLTLSSQEIGVETISSWQINWGDGTLGTLVGNPSSATHTYATSGQAYTITATATDQSGTYSANTVPVNVVTAVIGLTPITAPASAVPFQAVNASSIYYNPSTPGTLTGTWNWGDNSAPVAATIDQASGAVSGSYTYTNPGTYTVTLTVFVNGGSPVTATQTVVVTAAALEPDPANPSLTMLVVGGTPGNNIILFGLIGPAGTVSPSLNNRILGSFHADEIMAYGGTGNNTIIVSSKIMLPATLIGGPGNNTLVGGGGPTVLIGGTGSSKLTAGSGSTLLLAGSTAYDSNTRALAAIMAEWDSGDSYAQRVAYLTGTPGGRNGAYYLEPGVTVRGSDSASTLSGGSGRDLFFADYPATSSSQSVKKDMLSGLTQGEIIFDLSLSLR
jgi:PKD repeat protein